MEKWRLVEPFEFDAKGIGRVKLQQLLDERFRIIQRWSVKDRAREGVASLRQHNRYWPDGRDREAP